VAFHGCLQNYETVGDAFVSGAGYNGHAELNNIVVIYPQTIAIEDNPKGCFDWLDLLARV
jgi:poly(3-hydroxybutyrate) depolymerase